MKINGEYQLGNGQRMNKVQNGRPMVLVDRRLHFRDMVEVLATSRECQRLRFWHFRGSIVLFESYTKRQVQWTQKTTKSGVGREKQRGFHLPGKQWQLFSCVVTEWWLKSKNSCSYALSKLSRQNGPLSFLTSVL